VILGRARPESDERLGAAAHQAGVGRLVFAGQVTQQCILYSALDAYVRHFDVVIATDAISGSRPRRSALSAARRPAAVSGRFPRFRPLPDPAQRPPAAAAGRRTLKTAASSLKSSGDQR
jgi:hypothetical protein